jgi:hypothetical protein
LAKKVWTKKNWSEKKIGQKKKLGRKKIGPKKIGPTNILADILAATPTLPYAAVFEKIKYNIQKYNINVDETSIFQQGQMV